MRIGALVGLSALALAMTGCHTIQSNPNRILSVPVARDYHNLPAVTVEQAAQAVERARLSGAEHTAPYDYYSAELYLKQARRLASRHDALGACDYSNLAMTMAQAALRRKPQMAAAAPEPFPKNRAAAHAEFERLKARYEDLNKAKAAVVAPVIYARLTAALSRAEYDLSNKRGWREAGKLMRNVGVDIDTIRWQDSDGDGIPDMRDPTPFVIDDAERALMGGGPAGQTKAQRAAEGRLGVPDQIPKLDTIYFAEGSASLSAEAQGYLKGLKPILEQWPGLRLHISAYADSQHSQTYSMELSQRRAQEVQRYLVMLGVPASRLVVTYHVGQAGPPSGTSKAPTGASEADRVELVLK